MKTYHLSIPLIWILFNTISIPTLLVHSCSSVACPQILAAEELKNNSQTGLAIVEEKDWFKGEAPLSMPILIHPKKGENYVAVIERQLEGGIDSLSPFRVNDLGFSSLWRQSDVIVYGAATNQSCIYFVCIKKSFPIAVRSISIKIRDKIFKSQDFTKQVVQSSPQPTKNQPESISQDTSPTIDVAQSSQFPIGNILAFALKNAAPEPVYIRLYIYGGVAITKQISPKTIEAWKLLYHDAKSEEPDLGDSSINNTSVSPLKSALEQTQSSNNASTAQPNTTQANQQNYPIINGDVWQTGENLPRFEPILIQDRFEGTYLAVIDRNQKTGWTSYKTLVSKWSAQTLKVIITKRADGQFLMYEAPQLNLQIGSKSFVLTGEQNSFPISVDLAHALSNISNEKVTLSYQDSKDKMVTHEINSNTIKSWKIIYH